MGRWALGAGMVALLLVIGCGDSTDRLSRGEYSKRMTELGNQTGQDFGLFEARSGPEVRRAAIKMRDAQRRSADDLERLRPPKDAESAHKLLIEGERGLASDLDKLQKRIGRDPLDLVVVSQTVQRSPGSRKIRTAVEELRRKGYIEPSGTRGQR